MNIRVLTPRVEANQPRKLLYTFKIGKVARRSLSVRLKLAQDKGLVSWQTMSNANHTVRVYARRLLVHNGQREIWATTEAKILCERYTKLQDKNRLRGT